MRKGNRILLISVVVCFAFSFFLGLNFGFSALFIFPILFISAYVAYYLYQQLGKDTEENLKKGIEYAHEDIAAEKWLHESFMPNTLTYLKVKRRLVIVYSFLFVGLASFFWSYLNEGLLMAIRNFAYAGILFWLFVVYILTVPAVFSELIKIMPFQPKRYIFNDWLHAYLFLLPICFGIYLLFPYETIVTDVFLKLTSFPLFFLVYSLSFLCLYCMVYLYEQMQTDEKQRLEESVRGMLGETK